MKIPSWLRKLGEEHGVWLLVWLPLSLWFASPLWSARVLPLHDLPNSLAQITALHYVNDPAWNLSPYYERSIGPVPYLGHFYVVHLLTYLFRSVMRANLFYMIVYVLATPLLGLVFARSTGRSPWLAFLLLPLSVCYFFQWGFISFCVGTMVMLPTAAMLYRCLDEPRRGSLIALGLLTCALYFCHILPWAAFGIYALVLLLIELGYRRWKQALAAGLSMLPSVGLFLLGLGRAHSTGFIDEHAKYLAQTDTPSSLIQRLPVIFNLFRKINTDDWVQMGLMVAVLLLLASDRGDDMQKPARQRVRIPVAIVVFLLLTATTPFWVKRPFNWWMINVRFLMMAAAFGVFLPRGKIGNWRMGLLGVAIASSTLMPYYMTKYYKDFSRRAEPIIRLLTQTPFGSNTLLIHSRSPSGYHFDDPVLSPEITIWRELYNYPTIIRGGYDPYMYPNGFPIKPKQKLAAPKVESAMVQLAHPDEGKLDPYRMLAGWDYLLIKDDNQGLIPPDGLALVSKDRDWLLFRNLMKNQQPLPEEPPPEPLGDDQSKAASEDAPERR